MIYQVNLFERIQAQATLFNTFTLKTMPLKGDSDSDNDPGHDNLCPVDDKVQIGLQYPLLSPMQTTYLVR